MNDRQDIEHEVLLEDYLDFNKLTIGDTYEIMKEAFYTDNKTKYQRSLPAKCKGILLSVNPYTDAALLQIESSISGLNNVWAIASINDITHYKSNGNKDKD